MPIWRIDDGPVHGISWGRCQRAKEASLTGVRSGFPASFTSELPCANVSYYGPKKSYTNVLSLEPGTHTLWTGLMMMVIAPKRRCHLNAHSFFVGPEPDQLACADIADNVRVGGSVDRDHRHDWTFVSFCA